MCGEKSRNANSCSGCADVADLDQPACFAHLDRAGRTQVLNSWAASVEPLLLRSTVLTPELLGEIVEAATSFEESIAIGLDCTDAVFCGDIVLQGRRFAAATSFAGATFEGRVHFPHSKFFADANFDGATFRGEACFDGTHIRGQANFRQVSFGGDARFDRVAFIGPALFGVHVDVETNRRTEFRGAASFEYATFNDAADFGSVGFLGGAFFESAIFKAYADFAGASFANVDARFHRARFEGTALLSWSVFDCSAWFGYATFTEVIVKGTRFEGSAFFNDVDFGLRAVLGPMSVAHKLSIEFAKLPDAELDAVARYIDATGLTPNGRLTLSVASPDTRIGVFFACERADLSKPTILKPLRSQALDDLNKQREHLGASYQYVSPGNEDVFLVSLRGSDVAGLTCSDVDLTGCRFAEALNLDALRVDSEVKLGVPPPPHFWPPTRWRSRRWTIAEEMEWRHAHGHWPDWVPPKAAREWDQEPLPEAPATIVGIYRQLRKGREDAKDEPGAADFYYGEMEMRRHDTTRPRAERLIVGLYWLISGYGLRVGRAIAALTLLLILATVAFLHFGQTASATDTATSSDIFLYMTATAFRTSDSLLLDGVALTRAGELIRMVVGVLGPVFLGLALLAFRGRVKR